MLHQLLHILHLVLIALAAQPKSKNNHLNDQAIRHYKDLPEHAAHGIRFTVSQAGLISFYSGTETESTIRLGKSVHGGTVRVERTAEGKFHLLSIYRASPFGAVTLIDDFDSFSNEDILLVHVLGGESGDVIDKDIIDALSECGLWDHWTALASLDSLGDRLEEMGFFAFIQGDYKRPAPLEIPRLRGDTNIAFDRQNGIIRFDSRPFPSLQTIVLRKIRHLNVILSQANGLLVKLLSSPDTFAEIITKLLVEWAIDPSIDRQRMCEIILDTPLARKDKKLTALIAYMALNGSFPDYWVEQSVQSDHSARPISASPGIKLNAILELYLQNNDLVLDSFRRHSIVKTLNKTAPKHSEHGHGKHLEPLKTAADIILKAMHSRMTGGVRKAPVKKIKQMVTPSTLMHVLGWIRAHDETGLSQELDKLGPLNAVTNGIQEHFFPPDATGSSKDTTNTNPRPGKNAPKPHSGKNSPKDVKESPKKQKKHDIPKLQETKLENRLDDLLEVSLDLVQKHADKPFFSAVSTFRQSIARSPALLLADPSVLIDIFSTVSESDQIPGDLLISLLHYAMFSDHPRRTVLALNAMRTLANSPCSSAICSLVQSADSDYDSHTESLLFFLAKYSPLRLKAIVHSAVSADHRMAASILRVLHAIYRFPIDEEDRGDSRTAQLAANVASKAPILFHDPDFIISPSQLHSMKVHVKDGVFGIHVRADGCRIAWIEGPSVTVPSKSSSSASELLQALPAWLTIDLVIVSHREEDANSIDESQSLRLLFSGKSCISLLISSPPSFRMNTRPARKKMAEPGSVIAVKPGDRVVVLGDDLVDQNTLRLPWFSSELLETTDAAMIMDII